MASHHEILHLPFYIGEKVRLMECELSKGPEKFVRVMESSSYGSSSYGGSTVYARCDATKINRK